MVIMQNNKLEFRFPEVHEKAICSIGFQRTLRIPDDNKEYPLPPGLGNFPLLHTEDFADRLPNKWPEFGGAFLPVYQSEALWVQFHSSGYPFAVKVAAGKINAVTGKGWSNDLSKQPQDYVVIPRQPWLDGFCVQKGLIRQFVAMPLGKGYTAEEQITGETEFGGLQFIVYPMKAEYAEALFRQRAEAFLMSSEEPMVKYSTRQSKGMGLAPGGLMRQEICEDEYGDNVWDTGVRSRCFVHLLNSEQYKTVTGGHPPTKPPTADEYTKAGLPWFDYYSKDSNPLPGSQILSGLLSVGAKQVQKNEKIISDTELVDPKNIVKLGSANRAVEDGNW